MRSHDRSPAIVISAIAVVALVVSVLTVSFAGGGQAAVINPVIEVSNTCVVTPPTEPLQLTIWIAQLSAPDTIHSANNWFPDLKVTPDSKGNVIAANISYTPKAPFVPDAIGLVGYPNVDVQVVAASQCPKSSPPTQPCFATSVAVSLTVTGLSPGNIDASLTKASWYIDYPGRDNPPLTALPTDGIVSNGSAHSMVLANTASPGIHLITVIATGLFVTGVPVFEYWSYPVTFCAPPPPPKTTSTTPTTTTATTRPTTTTTAPSTTSTLFLPPPTTAGPTRVLTINPQVVAAGDVTQVHGVGFPPNTPVILQWEPGIGIVTAQVGPDGTFTTPFLVIPHDQLGTRLVQASGFPPTVSAPLLVELGPAEPRAAQGQWIFRRG